MLLKTIKPFEKLQNKSASSEKIILVKNHKILMDDNKIVKF